MRIGKSVCEGGGGSDGGSPGGAGGGTTGSGFCGAGTGGSAGGTTLVDSTSTLRFGSLCASFEPKLLVLSTWPKGLPLAVPGALD